MPRVAPSSTIAYCRTCSTRQLSSKSTTCRARGAIAHRVRLQLSRSTAQAHAGARVPHAAGCRDRLLSGFARGRASCAAARVWPDAITVQYVPLRSVVGDTSRPIHLTTAGCAEWLSLAMRMRYMQAIRDDLSAVSLAGVGRRPSSGRHRVSPTGLRRRQGRLRCPSCRLPAHATSHRVCSWSRGMTRPANKARRPTVRALATCCRRRSPWPARSTVCWRASRAPTTTRRCRRRRSTWTRAPSASYSQSLQCARGRI